jgi:mycothiol system anti-sigma-R factor
MECLDCIETTARLHLYIDRELSNEEIVVVQQHLYGCPRCECRFHFDMHIKRLIHERCAIERAPERLREKVLQLARAPMGKRFDIDPELAMEIRADLDVRE